MKNQPAVFLDRDGTIIEDLHYPREPEKVALIPNAVAGLRLLQSKGYLLFVISNQSGVGRGIISASEFKAVHARVCELLQEHKIEIAEFAYCLHIPEDECPCRKPKIGLIPKEFSGKKLDWKGSYVVGDRETDVVMADALGGKGALVLTGKGIDSSAKLPKNGAYLLCRDLLDFALQLPSVNS